MARDPVAAVFAVTELVEAILLGLQPRDLLLAQRINKDFKATIDASTNIQEKLFFKATSRNSSDGSLTLNPFLSRILDSNDRSCTFCFLHKELTLEGQRTTTRAEAKADECIFQLAAGQHVFTEISQLKDFLLPQSSEASWRQMYIAARPVLFDIRSKTAKLHLPSSYRKLITTTSMQDLVAAVDEHSLKCEELCRM